MVPKSFSHAEKISSFGRTMEVCQLLQEPKEEIVWVQGDRNYRGEAYKDHVHILEGIPPKYSVSQIMGCWKGKNSLMIYESMRTWDKYGNRHFWRRGYDGAKADHIFNGTGDQESYWWRRGAPIYRIPDIDCCSKGSNADTISLLNSNLYPVSDI